MTTSGVDSETSPDRPDQQRRRVSRAWLVTQAEGKPPSAGRAAGLRLLVCTKSSDVGSADRVAASRLQRPCRRSRCFGGQAPAPPSRLVFMVVAVTSHASLGAVDAAYADPLVARPSARCRV
jgi:hypothetical protein